MSYKLEKDWKSLHLGALYRFTSLQSTKDQFCDMTMREISDFCREMDSFILKFQTEGPGSCGHNLEAGARKMIVSDIQTNKCFLKLVLIMCNRNSRC